MKIENLTEHPVVILDKKNKVIMHIPPSGQVARVKKIIERTGFMGAIPLSCSRFAKIKDLPDQKNNCVYIVSKMVHDAAGRSDLYYPAEKVYENGKCVGCRSLGS